eukprot:2815549-Pleurochrysis_carterae.AAC.1
MSVAVCKESRVSRATPLSKLRTTSARKSRKSERHENLMEMSSKTVVRMGMREGEKQGSATAPAACARELLWRR